MATVCITQSTLRVHGNSKPIVARFDQPYASSDGGALLLKLVDDRLALTVQVAEADSQQLTTSLLEDRPMVLIPS